MRRKDREIKNLPEIEAVIRQSKVCRLAMCDNGIPYIVPLCFGYKDQILYFHSAKQGKKIEIISKNNQVCVEFDIDHEITTGKKACDWSMTYSSAIAFGVASLVDNTEEKQQALDIIMKQYGFQGEFEYSKSSLEKTLIIKVEINHLTGKRSA